MAAAIDPDGGGSNWNVEQVIEAVWQIDGCDDISGLMQRIRSQALAAASQLQE
jgi:hypothetical protein